MGHYYNTLYTERSDRKRLIADLIKGVKTIIATRKCLAHCLRGNVLWTVWECKRNDENFFRWIGCDILDYGGRELGWGHKPLEEDMGPCYYTCPISYIKMAGEPRTQTAKYWREDVIRMHSEKRAHALREKSAERRQK